MSVAVSVGSAIASSTVPIERVFSSCCGPNVVAPLSAEKSAASALPGTISQSTSTGLPGREDSVRGSWNGRPSTTGRSSGSPPSVGREAPPSSSTMETVAVDFAPSFAPVAFDRVTVKVSTSSASSSCVVARLMAPIC